MGDVFLVELLNFLDLLDDIAGIVDENFAVGRKHHAFCGALEDGDAEIVFQFLDGSADVGLGDQQRFGCAAERAGAGDFDSIFHVQYVHPVHSPPDFAVFAWVVNDG